MPQIPPQMENDVRFWLHQDMEHNLFFAMGFEDPALKMEALRLHDAFQTALAKGDLGALALIPTSQDFKRRALAATKARWTGSVYPSFIDHVAREIDWMLVRPLAGAVQTPEVICAINQLNADHAALAAHLLDPSATAFVNKAHDLHMRGTQIATGCAAAVLPTLLAISKNAATEADTLINAVITQKPPHIINPRLAAHVDREGKYFLGRLNAIPESPAPSTGYFHY